MSTTETSNPDPLSSSSLPSSFDSDSEFFDESRTQKLWRKIKQEPLIPMGCAATCYALYQATRSIRAGDKHQTNRMFRARVYAQGFTLLALVAGSIFYKDERLKRKTYEKVQDDKKAAEKREKWLRELEVRDNEDREQRARMESLYGDVREVSEKAKEKLGKAKKQSKAKVDDLKTEVDNIFPSKSMREPGSTKRWSLILWGLRTKEAWRRM